jgi:hypothetical protein
MRKFDANTSVRGAALAAAFALAGTACELQPGSDLVVPSTYELIRANGADLPVTLASDSVCITQLLGGSLHINEREYRSSYDIRQACAHGEAPRLPERGVTGQYRISGDSIYFVDPQGRATGAGVFGADTVIIRGPLHLLTFRRTDADSSTSL